MNDTKQVYKSECPACGARILPHVPHECITKVKTNMNVRELVKRLERIDPDKEVFIGFPAKNYLEQNEVSPIKAVKLVSIHRNPVTAFSYIPDEADEKNDKEVVVLNYRSFDF